MSEPENEPTLFPVSPEQALVDGRADDKAADPGPQKNAGREVRVLKAVGDYFATKRKRR